PSSELTNTAAATAPSPTRITMKVPMNSARQAPASVAVKTELICSVALSVTGSTSMAAFDNVHLKTEGRSRIEDGGWSFLNPKSQILNPNPKSYRYSWASVSARQ